MPTKESDKLLNFVTNLAGDRFLKVEREIGSGFYVLNIGEAERRQAKHDIRCVEDIVIELVRNSRDAGASQIFIASNKDAAGVRQLTIIDDGVGVASDFHDVIFEPRVTSKIDNLIEDRFGVHGRGMALYSIRSNVDEAKVVASKPNGGTILKLTVNTNILRERKDQSTFPVIKVSGDKACITSGPHNIWRLLVEISLESPSLDIFYGTAAEILATLKTQITGGDSLSERRLWAEALDADEPERLCRHSSQLGLKVSLRNCQRIMSGEIKALDSIKERLGRAAKEFRPLKIATKATPGPIGHEDLESFAQAISESFRNLGEKYFIKLDGKPRVACTKETIRIDIPVNCEDSW